MSDHSNYTRLSTTTHKLNEGAVSFSIAWRILWENETFIRRLEYLLETVPDSEYGENHIFIEELLEGFSGKYDAFVENVRNEKKVLGGNKVFVVKEVR